MNASVPFFRAKMAPAALATAIGMAFAMSVPAQAQYTYPGTASSSGHSARISPMRAGAAKPADGEHRAASTGSPQSGCSHDMGCGGMYGGGEADGGAPAYPNPPQRRAGIHPVSAHPSVRSDGRAVDGYGNGNPSMHRGEACPPGTPCAGPVPANGGNSDMPSGGYGTHESYGAASMQSPHEANAIHPIAAGGKASISPVRAGDVHGALNYGPSQTSNTNFRNSVSGKTSGPNTNVTGQTTSFIGPTGKQVNLNGMSNPSVTGPNGQKVGMDGPDLNHLGGGYGHPKGAGINVGGVVSAQNGSVSMKQTGGPPGVANGGPHFNNGGTAGVSDKADGGSTVGNYNDTHNPDGSPKSSDSGKSGSGSGRSFLSGLFDWGGGSKPDAGAGSGSHRIPNGGPVDPNAGADGIDRKSGVKVAKDEADMGPTAGPGEIVSGTGQVVQPGKKKGQDTGGGQTGDAGTTNSGGRNAQGAYIAPSGQDNVKKPKEVGTLKMDYNGKNGAIDPKLGGSNGGGGG